MTSTTTGPLADTLTDRMSTPNRMLIGGEWVEASDGQTIAILNPATEEQIGVVQQATASDIDDALAATEAGWQVWRKVDAEERSRVLRATARSLGDHVDELALILTREQGKPVQESRAEILTSIAQLDWFADEARRVYGRVVPATAAGRQLVLKEPIGPVAAFTPWNFPVLLATRKIAPALAAGCSVLLKPAEEAPSVILFIAEELVRNGLPPGVLNVVTGDPAAISAQVLRSDIIRKLSFTGSVDVGRQLARQAADGLLDLSLELGGHAPVLVFDDVDPVAAAHLCAAGKFRNAGQICISPTRFFVHERIADEFCTAFADYLSGLKVGDGTMPGTDVGPLANDRRLAGVRRLVGDAVDQGATVRAGGGQPEWADRGYYFNPTLLTDVPSGAAILHEEPFGPVAPVMTFADLDEATRRANETPFGLAGYVLTNRTSTAFDVVDALEVGIVGVNQFAVSSAALPFGGVKHSGIGRESGPEAMDAYTISKAVSLGPDL